MHLQFDTPWLRQAEDHLDIVGEPDATFLFRVVARDQAALCRLLGKYIAVRGRDPLHLAFARGSTAIETGGVGGALGRVTLMACGAAACTAARPAKAVSPSRLTPST
ncbi:hypothetical protein DBIPINDM_007541 (plasmid) [Mesorhizobium sp. AR02]|uniref:hypothetical protein n=1 Tax=Mesorhizobium sp. AR02 TaxID=2865837 RepID=UPI00215E5B3D|nr:hypothetical protein [Mesorhizobium sp. AR02]UVK50229.1 hypothetical protein DBIPINDM_007541 [Mesorhizobium sp. AR02]